jgi:hypothetical protein
MFEKIVYKKVYAYFEQKAFLYDKQYGLRYKK